jgi:hypothetical protein
MGVADFPPPWNSGLPQLFVSSVDGDLIVTESYGCSICPVLVVCVERHLWVQIGVKRYSFVDPILVLSRPNDTALDNLLRIVCQNMVR